MGRHLAKPGAGWETARQTRYQHRPKVDVKAVKYVYGRLLDAKA
jgi:hypothetical protein